MLQPGLQITIWCNDLSHPHSYLFSTLYSNATTPRLYQTLSLLKHLYRLYISYRDNSLAWQTRSLGIWASLAILSNSHHSFHAQAHHLALPSVPQHLSLCFLSHSCESLQPKMPISIFSVWKSTFPSMLTSVKPFSDFHLLQFHSTHVMPTRTFSYICLYMSMFSKSPWAP